MYLNGKGKYNPNRLLYMLHGVVDMLEGEGVSQGTITSLRVAFVNIMKFSQSMCKVLPLDQFLKV